MDARCNHDDTSHLLNDDSWVEIFRHLTNQDILTMAQVSRRFNALTNHKQIWSPRLHARFNTRLPDNIDPRRFYLTLAAEEQQLLHFFVTQKLIPFSVFKPESLSDEEWGRVVGLAKTGIHTFENNQLIANILHIDDSTIEHYYQLGHDLLTKIFQLPANFLNSLFILELENLYGAMYDAVSFQDEPISNNDNEKFTRIFNRPPFQNPKEQIAYVDSFLSLLTSIPEHCPQLTRLILQKQPKLKSIVFAKRHGCTYLHQAIEGEHYELAKELIEAGMDVNFCETYIPPLGGYPYTYASPLYLALTNLCFSPNENKAKQSAEFIEYLLKKGADPLKYCFDEATDKDQTPIWLCSKMIHENEELNNKFKKIQTPIMKASIKSLFSHLVEKMQEKISHTMRPCTIV